MTHVHHEGCTTERLKKKLPEVKIWLWVVISHSSTFVSFVVEVAESWLQLVKILSVVISSSPTHIKYAPSSYKIAKRS